MHCYIDGGAPRENEMSSDEIHKLIDEFADMGVWAIAFTGGEPTMHPDFVSFVQHARQRDLLVGIATNGLFLSDEVLQQLPRDGVIISVSLDDLHIGGNKPDSDFAVASRAILRSQHYGFPTNIMTNTHSRNIDRLNSLFHGRKAMEFPSAARRSLLSAGARPSRENWRTVLATSTRPRASG
ncbi:MAG: radical SAM protein [Caulobacteraceae bacterium]|nr:radical SAM protein [Caulobacteraceae bacterium]